MVKLLCTSDLHFRDRYQPIADKQDNLEYFRSMTEVDGILVPGDLTDHGYDGVWFPNRKNELAGFLRWRREAEKVAPVYACHGNHDTYVDKPFWDQAVRMYIIWEYGYTFYHRRIRDIHLLVFGKQPMDSSSSVRQLLKKVKNNPFIIMCHYNMQGPYSDFWSDRDKRQFYRLISPYLDNLICIIHGHRHVNLDEMWQPFEDQPAIRCIGVGGPGVTGVEYVEGQLIISRSITETVGSYMERSS